MSVPVPAQLVVLAKRPIPGRAKTRLTPPYTPLQAAALAAAALRDTLDAVLRTPVQRRVLALDGPPTKGLPGLGSDGLELLPQRGDRLDERIANALADAWVGAALPLLLIGMDTPQVSPLLLTAALQRLLEPGVDAVLGPATDGGFWALGVRRPHVDAVRGVEMSTTRTGREQLARLRAAGLTVRRLAQLRDVDTARDARVVAAGAPGGSFAAVLGRLPVPAASVRLGEGAA